MKKIYMGFCLLAALFTFPNFNLFAQSNLSNCFGNPSTAPNAKVFHLKGFNSPGPLTNSLSFTDIPTGTIVRIYPDLNVAGTLPLVVHTFITTDNGKFSWSYPNNIVTPPVVICVSTSALGGCCLKNVPAILNCTEGRAINFKPFVDFGQCRMLIKVNIGDAIQLLDAAGQVIPGVVEVQARVNVGNGQEVACVTYPCAVTIGTITGCDTVNCCSRPFVAGAPLPIFLLGFAVNLNQQGKAVLNWSSALEINSKSYIIEKGTNGIDFIAVGQVDAPGSSLNKLNYSFTDKNAVVGTTYYRLKMLDIDDKFEYSKVVPVNGKVGNMVTAGPNPFTTSIQLYGVPSAEVNLKNIQVFNAVGQRINYKVTGANTITLEATATTGIYIIKIKEQQIKMLKQ
jgi:hypothetical protein